ncbi:MAG: type II toxin-antitoxin system RelE/ParE family toxin [Bryobacterales bacterium]|nr:type II toxin-antitoxin system RelE/ParE family toxin [Bryobacterales bacterium]
MTRNVAYAGKKFTIAFAREKNGTYPAEEFMNGQMTQAEQVKLAHLFLLAGDHGDFSNDQKFGDLKNGMYEFKVTKQIRFPFAYSGKESRTIVVTHGFVKKKDKAPKEDIERAWRIFREDQDGRLTLVGKGAR